MSDRRPLPQLEPRIFLTDSGLETTLIFLDGLNLPQFAAFVLLETASGRERLRVYFERHASIAREAGSGFIAEAPTWRANPDWGRKLGYDTRALDTINREAISFLADLRDRGQWDRCEYVISGCIGPRGDGYAPCFGTTAETAKRYHAPQVEAFSDAGADLVSALTMTHVEEAIGATWAAQDAGMPAVISFTVETDGRLPSGVTLRDAILQVDTATDRGPAYYMINCAHPTHFASALEADAQPLGRLRGVRANASRKSHAELGDASELDAGHPEELAAQYVSLTSRFPGLTILGGCCGTDERHIRQIARACTV